MPGIRLRPENDADLPRLRELYASTRREELAPLPWPETEKLAFLDRQFEAQRRHYREHFPETAFDVIEVDGAWAGRLYVDRRADEIRLVDIALLPQWRGRGIGTQLLRELMGEARRRQLPLRIHVEKQNRAYRLYVGLGFRAIEDKGVYDLLEWRPQYRETPPSGETRA